MPPVTDISWCVCDICAITDASLVRDPNPDSKVPEANMGSIWGQQDQDGPYVGPMNFAIWVKLHQNELTITMHGIRVPTGPYFREKSLFSIVALPALEKSLLLNIFDRSPGKVLIFNRCVKTWMINIVLRKLRFSKCCGNDVELFGNPSDPLTNHRWRVVWRHLVPAKIPRASFIKFYYVVTLSQSADTWCHVVVVRNLIGPQSRRYTWRTLRKTPSIFVEIRQHT